MNTAIKKMLRSGKLVSLPTPEYILTKHLGGKYDMYSAEDRIEMIEYLIECLVDWQDEQE